MVNAQTQDSRSRKESEFQEVLRGKTHGLGSGGVLQMKPTHQLPILHCGLEYG